MDNPDVDGDFSERLERLRDAIDETCQPIGLYLRGLSVVPAPGNDVASEPKLVVVAHFDFGDLAFDDRIQHPDRYSQDERTRLALEEAGLDEDPTEAILEIWRERRKRIESKEGGGSGDNDTGTTGGAGQAGSGGSGQSGAGKDRDGDEAPGGTTHPDD